ncbi:hypothetical protein QRD43_05845 [Pelomonas sp. APW6]|uniref:Uncharacterized protein n=1 Tax=Roseateles subflavus TaxID=3053353 RepID=A0ABT7LEZ1_9BURK|nr:hypothetical protein [Pelomonas sp. APW6]MDL5031424.1 hypothetical protein [Pelomonas sp. APW6]
MQKIIKTSRLSVVSSTTDHLSALLRRVTQWLSAPPARREAAAQEPTPSMAHEGRPRRRAGDPIGSVHFDGERLGGWPGEGRIR